MTGRAALLVLAVLAPLAACGGDANTPQAQCEQQAYNDPAVKLIMQQRVSGNDYLLHTLLPAQRDAVKAATLRCLQQRGLAPPGGVEKQKRDYD